jgi:hypothetical protein
MRKTIFLYLALACFAGIIAIFFFDGYMGLYDTVYLTTGEWEQKIGPDYWQNQPRGYAYPYSLSARWGEAVHFRYEIDNRRFSEYSATVEASVWKSNEKVMDLFNQNVTVSAFDKVDVDWTLSAEELQSAGFEIDQYTVRIKRGEYELGAGIILSYYSPEEPVFQRLVPPIGR